MKNNKKYHRGVTMKRNSSITEIIEKIKLVIAKEKNSDKKIKEIDRIRINGYPQSLVLSNDDTKAYVANGNGVVIIDCEVSRKKKY